MKQLVAFSLLLLIYMPCSGQANASEQLAGHIAQKMKDSLALTTVQKDSIYAINLRLLQYKTTVRQQYGTDSLLLQQHLQHTEWLRDSLYRPILGEELYPLYKIKRRTLLTGN